MEMTWGMKCVFLELSYRTFSESALQKYKIKLIDFSLRYIEHLKYGWFNKEDICFWSSLKKNRSSWTLGFHFYTLTIPWTCAVTAIFGLVEWLQLSIILATMPICFLDNEVKCLLPFVITLLSYILYSKCLQ